MIIRKEGKEDKDAEEIKRGKEKERERERERGKDRYKRGNG